MSGHTCEKPDLFLSGLPIAITQNALRSMLKRVTSEPAFVQIIRRKRGVMMPRAIAFIRLAPCAAAEPIIEKLNNTMIDGHSITVAKFKPANARQAPRACFHSAPHPTWAAHIEGTTSEAAQ